jgi:hypothetical protein
VTLTTEKEALKTDKDKLESEKTAWQTEKQKLTQGNSDKDEEIKKLKEDLKNMEERKENALKTHGDLELEIVEWKKKVSEAETAGEKKFEAEQRRVTNFLLGRKTEELETAPAEEFEAKVEIPANNN